MTTPKAKAKATPKQHDKATMKALCEQHQSIRQMLAADLARMFNTSFFSTREGVVTLPGLDLTVYFSNQGDTPRRRAKLDHLKGELDFYCLAEVARAYFPRPEWAQDKPAWTPADPVPPGVNADPADPGIGYTCVILIFGGSEDDEDYVNATLDEFEREQMKTPTETPAAA